MASREDSSVELDRWEQGAVLWNTVHLTKNDALPHRPDALFTLRFPNAPEGQQRSNFVYEADRETANLTRIRQKLEAHLAFFSQGLHVERYGFRKLRAVLVETLTMSRREQIRELTAALAAKEPLAGMLFWFSSTENPMPPFKRRWTCAADSRPRSLLD
jgi:LPS sulfotransferase NodH